MSLQAALHFLAAVREQPPLQRAIERLGAEAPLEAWVRMAQEAGWELTERELAAAFRVEWDMRWLRYGMSPPTAGPRFGDGLGKGQAEERGGSA